MCTTYRKEDCGKDVARYALQEKTWWDTRSFLAHVIHDALVQFKGADRNGYPVANFDHILEGEDVAWEQSLDKMIEAFTLLKRQDEEGPSRDENEYQTIESGLLEFAAGFQHLWD